MNGCICKYSSPLGLLEISCNDGALLGISFIFGFKEKYESKDCLQESLLLQLEEFFQGKRKVFEVEFVLKGTAFQKKVWREILKIPYGQTLSYGQLAINIGHPNSYRAIGATCGANPLPIIIPCHRVISKTGALIGYNGGLDRKKWLLDFEKSQTPVYIKKK